MAKDYSAAEIDMLQGLVQMKSRLRPGDGIDDIPSMAIAVAGSGGYNYKAQTNNIMDPLGGYAATHAMAKACNGERSLVQNTWIPNAGFRAAACILLRNVVASR